MDRLRKILAIFNGIYVQVSVHVHSATESAGFPFTAGQE